MARTLIAFLLGIVLAVMIACSGDKRAETKHGEMLQTQTTEADTANAICPGCGMEMAKSEMIKYVAGGKTLYFCSKHCQENYLATLEDKTTPSEKVK